MAKGDLIYFRHLRTSARYILMVPFDQCDLRGPSRSQHPSSVRSEWLELILTSPFRLLLYFSQSTSVWPLCHFPTLTPSWDWSPA